MNTELKHGDMVSLNIGGQELNGHIEERYVNQSPDKRMDLFVIIDDNRPRFPVSVNNFKENYGTITFITN